MALNGLNCLKLPLWYVIHSAIHTPTPTLQCGHMKCFVCAKMNLATSLTQRYCLRRIQLDWTWDQQETDQLFWVLDLEIKRNLGSRLRLVNLCLLILLFYCFPRTHSSDHLQCCSVATQVSIASDIILHPRVISCSLIHWEYEHWTRLQLRKCPFSQTWLDSQPLLRS